MCEVVYLPKKSVCIICEKEKAGVPVKEDRVIQFIRGVKNRLGIAKGYRLVVCNSCWAEYEKKRKSYERSMLTWLVLGAALLVVMLILFLLTGRINLFNMIMTVFMIAVLFLIMAALVFISRYIPKTEMSLEGWIEERRRGPKAPRQPKVRKKKKRSR